MLMDAHSELVVFWWLLYSALSVKNRKKGWWWCVGALLVITSGKVAAMKRDREGECVREKGKLGREKVRDGGG